MEGRRGLLLSLIMAACFYGNAAQIMPQSECAKVTVADIVFLVDGSSSIGIDNFTLARDFLKSVITGLDIGPDKVRIGLAQYSDEPHQEFLLKDHMDKSSLLPALDEFPYRTGNTATGKAMDFLVKQYFTEEAGSRAKERVPQIAVVITNGDSADDIVAPAKSLRQHGVIVFGIGVGQANLMELKAIANRPSERFLLTIDSYQALQRLTEGLLQTLCISVEDQRQALEEKFADIVFLVDSAVSVQEFQQIRTLLTRLVNQMNFGASAYRLGLAQYARDVRVEFLLKAHQTKEVYLSAIRLFRQRRLQPYEARNLGSALEYVYANFFTSEAGSRADQGYQQHLVIVTGKDSDDPVYRASHLIKSSGINVVGMSAGASLSELRIIANPAYIYTGVITIVPTLRAIFEAEKVEATLTGDCKAANVADIVFIVDESGSIGTANFKMVRTFLHSIVSGLEISWAKVRVGIVMYSNGASPQVYLDSFDDKSELLNFIKILPYRGGGTNTGAALNYARDNVFIKARGSRKEQGVQQVAVVITDGKSQDDVSTAAADLRRAGVTIYAIGVKEANKALLDQMASYPHNKHVFNVDNFEKLKGLELSLQKSLCHNIIQQAISVSRRSSIKEGCVKTEEADIFFLIDNSGSIFPTDFQDMKNFITEFIHTFRISPEHVRIGVVKYADSPQLEFDLARYSDTKSLEKAIEGIKQIGGGTKTGRALEYMGPLFDRTVVTPDHKVPEYLVVITDGKSSDQVKVPAEKLRAQGIIVYAIGVKSADPDELEKISGNPKRTFFVNNFDALRSIKDDIITDICSQDICKDIPVDLLFLVDSSGSIDPEDYKTMKDFMKSVISRSMIGRDEVHVGVMQFSSIQQLEFSFNRYYSKYEILSAIDNMNQIGGGTETGAAITALSQYFDPDQGGRPDMRQRLVVITDGESQDEVKAPAAALRAKGVVVFAIGVMEANTTQLLEISGSPERMYAERDFDALKDLESHVAFELCDPERDCKRTEKADIIFLVDGSTSITLQKFRSMQKFMKSVVRETTVGKELTRFGVILYSTNPQSIFTLKHYDSKRQVLKAIDALKSPYGDTYTSRALAYTLDYFNQDNGGRAALRVPQILMVITDGDATDRSSLVAPSVALRDNGISVFSIGVEGANKTQLEVMAGGDKSKVFYVDNFEALEYLYKTVTHVLCNSTKPVCKDIPGDLLFLVDSSGSIDPEEYKTMKDFMKSVISRSMIGRDEVQVGVMQFSSFRKLEFPLDRYNSKDEILSAINNMRQIGGGSDIGAAITALSQYFDPDRGGRPDMRQRLVVITDGESQDEVKVPAAALRAKGVVVFAIGVREANTTQLLEISGSPERMYAERDFDALKDLESHLALELCDPERDCKKTGKADIIFLVDGSTSITLQKFRSMQKFMKSVVSETTVGKELTRFGVFLYSTNPQSIFTLKQYDSKRQVLKAIDALKSPFGDTYTGRALACTLDYFNQDNGGRAALRVPQILMVITDGDVTDRSSLVEPSVALRDNGITVFSIGVEGANKAQLEVMAGGDKSKVFYVDNFEALENLYKNVTHVLCNSTKPALWDGNTGLINAQTPIFTEKVGGKITYACSFLSFSGSRKIFCKEECEEKDILVETTGDRAQRGRYGIRYEGEVYESSSFLYVSITNLTKSDSGRYRCRLDRNVSSSAHKDIEIRVEDAPTTCQPFPASASTLTTAAKAVQLYVRLTLVVIFIVSSAAVLIFFRRRASKAEDPPVEAEYLNVTEANPVHEELREDRQSRSPPVEMSAVHNLPCSQFAEDSV
ncbi:collagen alpha-6(VI) chain-like [Sparus aurata]|uniref:collagen alpha-6(VI) chain-like n=1 Tax=Sparus aurata TaxID=8175 RepID=UPI0011C122EF|nr:collagen alpha-6(VI) chain-like [Sparus aurata]